GVPVGALPAVAGAAGHLTFVDAGAPPGYHRYEVRALTDLAGLVLQESETAAIEGLAPYLVMVDPGHGGHDPGAVARL
ncbi:MAG: hypothetical protein ACRD0M_09965, partial [Acidimicrobiales bacterium]